MREIKRIFVHCTAGSQKQTKEDLLREFRSRGWTYPGYHYVVFPDGTIDQLLNENTPSNGVQGYNQTSINVAYVGGVDAKLRPVDNRTDKQRASLRSLLEGLKRTYPNAHIMGHRDIWGKDSRKWKKMCPCFDAEKEYAYLDDMPLGKYDDATEDNTLKMMPASANPANYEKYVLEHPRDYTGFLKDLAPWRKTN